MSWRPLLMLILRFMMSFIKPMSELVKSLRSKGAGAADPDGSRRGDATPPGGEKGGDNRAEPTRHQVTVRHERIRDLVALDTELLISRARWSLWRDVPYIGALIQDSTRVQDGVRHLRLLFEQACSSIDQRSPIVRWTYKHLLLPRQSAMADLSHQWDEMVQTAQVEAHRLMQWKPPRDTGRAPLLPAAEPGAAPTDEKTSELLEALLPYRGIVLSLVQDASKQNPRAAFSLGRRATQTLALLGAWRAAVLVNAKPRARYALMNRFLHQVSLTVAECRAVLDPEGCDAGSACRNLLEHGCAIEDGCSVLEDEGE